MMFKNILNLRWLLFAALVLFICKGLNLAAINDSGDITEEDIEDYDLFLDAEVDEYKNELDESIHLRKTSLSNTIKTIRSNFADDADEQQVVFHAMLQTFKDQVYDDLQINAKKKFGFSFDKLLNKTKAVVKDKIIPAAKKAGKKAMNATKKAMKKGWKAMKNVTKHCLKETMKEMKKLPAQLGKEFEVCATQKMESCMTLIAEHVDFSTVPLSANDVQTQLNNCIQQNRNSLSCLADIIGNVMDILGTKISDDGEDKAAVAKVLSDMMACADVDKMMNTSLNTAQNAPIKCLMDLAMSKLAEEDEEEEEEEAQPAA